MPWNISSASYAWFGGPTLFSTSGFTITAWYRWTSGAGPILERYTGPSYGFTFGAFSSAFYTWFYDNSGFYTYIGRAGGFTFTSGQWVHLAVTYNGGSSYTDVVTWANGSAITAGSFSNGSFTTLQTAGDAPLATGGTSGGLGGSHVAAVSDLCVHNVQLTADEIKQQMRFPGTVRRGMTMYLPGSSTRSDYSGNAYNPSTDTATNYSGADRPPISGRYLAGAV